MLETPDNLKYDSVGGWAKRFYFASRAAMDAVLRPYDLGATQWYILYHLANDGPTIQRELVQILQVERATLSEVVGTLVRKGFVEQASDHADRRQRLLCLTVAGRKLWEQLPDPIAVMRRVAFDGIDNTDLATAVSVLKAATQCLHQHAREGSDQ